MPHASDVTRLLAEAREGDAEALNELIPIVYEELRVLARRQRKRRSSGETMNTTALVHQAYEKLARNGMSFADRQHFFRVAARGMRDLLVDTARRKGAIKRGEGETPLPLNEDLLGLVDSTPRVLALDDALTRLAVVAERLAEVVQLRYFVGLTIPETADVLGISESTVKREWTTARAWLHHDLSTSE